MEHEQSTQHAAAFNFRLFVIAGGVVAAFALAGVLLHVLVPDDEQLAIENLNAARTEAREFLGNPADWQSWYEARIEGSEGCAEFRNWCAATANLDDSLGLRAGDLIDRIGPDPSDATAIEQTAVQSFLADTQAASAKAAGLLAYDNLTGVPAITDGMPDYSVIDTLNACKVLTARVYAHAWLGDMDAAWRECATLLQLASRMRLPSSLVEYMVNVAVECLAHQAFVQLCRQACPPAGFDALYPAKLPQDLTVSLLESELAFAAQMPEYDEQMFANFGPQPSAGGSPLDKLLNRRDSSDAIVESVNDWAGYLRLTIQYVRASRDGAAPPKPNTTAESIWRHPDTGRWQLACARLRANLAFSMRRAEAGGTPLLSYKPDSSVYSSCQPTQDKTGLLTIDWDVAAGVREMLASPLHDPTQVELTPEALPLMPLLK
ncbi:MAG: hypothetical protein H6840_10795 [Planctomycetes bacterium]|nr:hypothetical protein [Planctomycetota bacterium]